MSKLRNGLKSWKYEGRRNAITVANKKGGECKKIVKNPQIISKNFQKFAKMSQNEEFLEFETKVQ